MSWIARLELGENRQVVSGSAELLAKSIANAADMRIETEFRHNEHIDVNSDSNELIREVAEFAITYLIEDTWVAGVMNLRQPIELPKGFGPRASMSLFMYNQDGSQSIARPYLEKPLAQGMAGPSTTKPPEKMTRYNVINAWDAETNAPSQNFVYEFDCYRFYANESWRPVLQHSDRGVIHGGSLDELVDAFSSGHAIKMAIGNLCTDLALNSRVTGDGTDSGPGALKHVVFVQGGSAYYYTRRRLFMMGSHPVVRVRPAIPMQYSSSNWDFGWLFARSDGRVVYRRCDPYTLRFADVEMQCPISWFAR